MSEPVPPPGDPGERPSLVEVYFQAPDAAREIAFWEQAIGLLRLRRLSAPDPARPVAVFDLGGPRLGIVPGAAQPSAPRSKRDIRQAIVIRVPDIEATVQRVLAHGGRLVEAVVEAHEGVYVAYVASPGGFAIGLLQGGDETAQRERLGQPPSRAYGD